MQSDTKVFKAHIDSFPDLTCLANADMIQVKAHGSHLFSRQQGVFDLLLMTWEMLILRRPACAALDLQRDRVSPDHATRCVNEKMIMGKTLLVA